MFDLQEATTTEYLTSLYGGCDDGNIVFVNTKPGTEYKQAPAYFHVSEIEQAAEFVESYTGTDLFMKVNVMDHAKSLSRSAFAVGGSDDVKAIVSIHLDADAGKNDKYLTPTAMRAALDKMPLQPSGVILTNGDDGGFHAYWLLDEPFYIATDADRKRCQNISSAWLAELRHHAKPGTIDGTANLDRVLRPVGSLRKSGNRVRVKEWNDLRRYKLDDFKTIDRSAPKQFYDSKPFDGDSPIEKYLDANGLNCVEAILQGQGYEDVSRGFWRRPGSESGAPTGEVYYKDGRQGFTVKSGAADPLSCENPKGATGNWYSVSALWVSFHCGVDASNNRNPQAWKQAAEYCKQWLDARKPKADVSGILQRGCSSEIDAPPSDPNHERLKPCEKYQEFPTNLLPSPLRDLVEQGAPAIGCDESYIALPLLSAVGAAIGNTCRLVVKKGWNVPPAIWTLICGESGTAKSPAFKLAKAPIQRHQKQLLDEFADLMADYEKAIEVYENQLKEHKKRKTSEPPPDKPQPPKLDRVVVSDCTVEALAPILRQNPKGLLLQRDELSGWLGSFNQYKSAKGSDEAAWLSMFDGESITVDRKGEGTVPTYVDTALVGITGGIQPAVLASSMTKEHRASGMASRFLIAQPPRKAQSWTDEEVGDGTLSAVDDLFAQLLAIDFDDAERHKPHFIGLSKEAKQFFRSFFNSHHQEQADLTGDDAAAWSKLLGYVPRLALVFHVVTQLEAGEPITEAVSTETMQRAILLVEWFKNEAARLYATIDDTDDQRELREVASWIDRRGGQTTPRDLCRGFRSVGSVDDADKLCQRLVKAGLGRWEMVETESGTGPQIRSLRTI
jgi:hypothetical protein